MPMDTTARLPLERPQRTFPAATAAPLASAKAIRWPCLLPALTTALLLSLCHFTILPVVCGWFAWVALVPLLCLVRSNARPWRVYLAAWVGGLTFFWFVLQWMRVADIRMYATWAMLATWCSLFVPLSIFLLRRLDRRTCVPLIVTVPVVWTGLEFIRAHLLTGFPWYFLGHTQHDFLPAIQIADLGGAYAVTFVVAAVNALVFESLYALPGLRARFALPSLLVARRPGLPLQALAVVLLLVGTFGYGVWRLHGSAFEPGPRVALLQGNEPQAVRNAKYNDVDQEKVKAEAGTHVDYLALHDIAERAKPDLIVWPETSYYRDGVDYSNDFLNTSLEIARKDYNAAGKGVEPPTFTRWRQVWIEHYNAAMMSEAKTWPSAELLGLNVDEIQLSGARKFRNSALLLLPGGQYGGRYDKVHRVPWGEYVPLKDWIPAMNTFAPYDHDYSIAPGDEMTRFPLGAYHFGTVICYEDSDPYLARQLVSQVAAPLDWLTRLVAGGMYDHLPNTPPNAKPVDFFINTSNDGWFDGTSEHEEHLAVSRFRAVECRRSLIRAVNMGISAVIDANGRVLAPNATQVADHVRVWEITGEPHDLPPSEWKQYKKVAGVLIVQVPIDNRDSLYVRWGDWLPAACWLWVALAILWPLRKSPPAPLAT